MHENVSFWMISCNRDFHDVKCLRLMPVSSEKHQVGSLENPNFSVGINSINLLDNSMKSSQFNRLNDIKSHGNEGMKSYVMGRPSSGFDLTNITSRWRLATALSSNLNLGHRCLCRVTARPITGQCNNYVSKQNTFH